MSADNAVAICVTKGRKSELEFRIAEVWGDWNMTEGANFPAHRPRYNEKRVLKTFGEAPVITDAWEAIKQAQALIKKIGVVEYGLQVMNFSDTPFPTRESARG